MDNKLIRVALNTAIKASNRAAKYLLKMQNDVEIVRYKSNNDLLTNSDLESDKIISQCLTNKFPDFNIFSEESTININSDYTFFIDPLDGTINYFSNLPIFGISISLLHRERTLFGLINIPAFRKLYYCDIQNNTFQFTVSDKSKLKDAVISIILTNHFNEELKFYISNLINVFSKKCLGVRIFVSSSYEFSLLMTGCIDAVIIPKADLYGVKAGEFLVEKANGITTNLYGNKFENNGDFIISSNKYLHKEILDLINQV